MKILAMGAHFDDIELGKGCFVMPSGSDILKYSFSKTSCALVVKQSVSAAKKSVIIFFIN